jgi:hypothetical protein
MTAKGVRPFSAKRGLTLFLVGFLFVAAMAAPAGAALQLSTDHRSVFFGVMQLGEEKTLAHSGTYHNTVTVSSDGGQSWYLKISVLQPLTSGAHTIPLEAFTWQVTSTTGSGTLAQGNAPRPFFLTPDLVYLSGPNEAGGQPIQLQFRYALRVPDAQASGVYQTTIRFTLTEVL